MRFIRDGEKDGKGVWRWGKREIIYLSLHCHHQNDSCIKMGSDESHFNVSVGSDGKVTGQRPQTTTFLKREENRSGIEPRSFRLPAWRLTARPNRLTIPFAHHATGLKKLSVLRARHKTNACRPYSFLSPILFYFCGVNLWWCIAAFREEI